MYILGISAFYHDSAACLLHNDELIAAAQEERFTRIKNDDSFPEQAIKFCLQHAQINLTDVQHIVFYEKPFLKFERLLETYISFAPRGMGSFLKAMPLWLKDKLFLKSKISKKLNGIDPEWKLSNQILFTDHHHAFFPSPFAEAVILTVDGVGEWATTTVSVGKQNRIKLEKEIRFPHSLGLLYSAFTYYLGFQVNSDEYKVMGLAPYGKPLYADLIYKHLLKVQPDGSFWLNMDYFNYGTGLTMTNHRFSKLFGAQPRLPHEDLLPFHQNIARSIQRVIEEVMIKITSHLYLEYGIDNLCLAGGVALNCVCNAAIRRQSGFKQVWVQPAAGDAGGALGAAFSVYYEYLAKERLIMSGKDKMHQALLGPCYSEQQIHNALTNAGYSCNPLTTDEFYKQLAQCLAEGKVVGYFNGRAEFGPRALGSRSILADPRIGSMQTILNQKIKLRESFRPFAPAIIQEFAADYFEDAGVSPYMLFTFQAKAQTALLLPAVIHVDGSARVQTVNEEQHPDFYRVIKAFYELTGCPVLINTSFNVMNEPVVCSPQDAIHCFQNTEMDVLAIGRIIVHK
jgi:carbamoyltransferase